MIKQLITGFKCILLMTVLTGIMYPATITFVNQFLFRAKANGSLIIIKGSIRGSKLIGQKFGNPEYFWPRPSAVGYNSLPSGGSNLSLSNPELKEEIIKREAEFREKNGLPDSLKIIPPDIICSSASGLDPDISPEAAMLQVHRVAVARSLTSKQEEQLKEIIVSMSKNQRFSILGEPRINVFLLNLKTENLK
jgi:K+-transporting ATPase ATPase C chain